MKHAHAVANPQLTSDQAVDVLARLASRRVVFLDFLRRRVPPAADPEDLFQRALLIAARRIFGSLQLRTETAEEGNTA